MIKAKDPVIHTHIHTNSGARYLLGSGRKSMHVVIISVVLFLIYLASLSWISLTPVVAADTVIFVNHDANGTGILTEVRKYVGDRVELIHLSRYLYEESNRSNFFVVEGGSLDTLEGEFSVMKTMLLPPWVIGRWCSSSTVSWRPQWSQRTFTSSTQDVCFETTEYE